MARKADCCRDEESSNGQGGGCHTCRGGLALPRVGEGMTGEQVATLIDAMLEEVHDDPVVTDALRFVLHVTPPSRGPLRGLDEPVAPVVPGEVAR